jgi:hypothetical protein
MKFLQFPFVGDRVSDPDPDPHLFELLNPDPDPHTNCGSGSRRTKNDPKKLKKDRIFIF